MPRSGVYFPAMTTRRIHPLSIWIPIIIIVLGLVVGWNYMVHLKMKNENPDARPPLINRLEKDIELIERSGRKVRLSDLAGDVYLVSYVFTNCPKQCIGVIGSMRDVDDAFRGEDGLRFLAVSLDPEADSPERLKEWASIHGADKANWWFLTTGDPEALASYMHREMFFIRAQLNTDPEIINREGKWAHDPRVALVDHKAHVRGFYNLIDPDFGALAYQKLLRDLRVVLDERKADQRPR